MATEKYPSSNIEKTPELLASEAGIIEEGISGLDTKARQEGVRIVSQADASLTPLHLA